MGAKTVVIGHIARQDALEVPFVQDDDVMEHLTAHTANQSLDIWILPRTPWCDQYFFNAHMLEPLPKEGAIDTVAIAQQIPRHCVPRKCLDHLLRRPLGGGMLGDVNVYDTSSFVHEDHEHEEDLVRHGRNRQEIEGH